MLKWYMHKRERYFAMLNDDRVVQPFEWGTEFITENANGSDPREAVSVNFQSTLSNTARNFSLVPRERVTG